MRRSHPNYNYYNSAGAQKTYPEFGSCIRVERGQNITIADNDISDCQQALYTKSTDEGDFGVSKQIRIAGNHMWNNGIVGSDRLHTSYTASAGIVFEFNHYGPVRAGARGNSIKDRSTGTVVRYNRIETGARAIDLAEAEDFPVTATRDPAYRSTFVYGNVIVKNGNDGSFIHYGGDHFYSAPGNTWGEPIFRKGSLYFFNNTVHMSGTSVSMFQLSTTEETAEVWNNVFVAAPSVTAFKMRSNSDVGAGWTSGGIVNLGKNWATTGWRDGAVPGQLNGQGNMLAGSASPVDPATSIPLAGSAVVNAGQPPHRSALAHPVQWQLKPGPIPRPVIGTAIDLGAIEK
ncbi:hypothetical protein [Massilia antarctica]|uniref:hypothetical protein n=1 Tax=Massilia antarctica TaxID=2765360 RepID=UPI0006BB5C20|nr:hypothetical protein [Massilia sp. H27-R4]MCY0910259.1 hypothetical protein [Massilia sp. H27-R4]CUI09396.1 Sheath polysaccharide-degrading enzyme precursor [Janthinobacterium sp. CG23_2]CUU33182.1 Sheath polysaccharide-degrading enzyme precursor [Janthinobacterium sp. CG23_2]